MKDLWAALALVAIIEGLVLFVMPSAWQRTMVELSKREPKVLQRIGAGVLIAGLVSLWLVRGG